MDIELTSHYACRAPHCMGIGHNNMFGSAILLHHMHVGHEGSQTRGHGGRYIIGLLWPCCFNKSAKHGQYFMILYISHKVSNSSSSIPYDQNKGTLRPLKAASAMGSYVLTNSDILPVRFRFGNSQTGFKPVKPKHRIVRIPII